MNEDKKDISLSDLGLEEESTPAEQVQQKQEVTEILNPDGSGVRMSKLKLPKDYKFESTYKPPDGSFIIRPHKDNPERDNPANWSTISNVMDIATTRSKTSYEQVKENRQGLLDLADQGIERAEREATARGGRIDDAKKKYIEYNYSIMMNKAKDNPSLQKRIKWVNDVIDSDARFDGITETERKGYIYYKVSKDLAAGIDDKYFNIEEQSLKGPRDSKTANKALNKIVNNKNNIEADEYLTSDEPFIIGESTHINDDLPSVDLNSASIKNQIKQSEPIKKEEIEEDIIVKEEDNNFFNEIDINQIPKKKEKAKMDNKEDNKIIEEKKEIVFNANENIKPKEEVKEVIPVEDKIEVEEEVKEVVPVKDKIEVKEEEIKPKKEDNTETVFFKDEDILTADSTDSLVSGDAELPSISDEQREQNRQEYFKEVMNLLNQESDFDDFSEFEISKDSINLRSALEGVNNNKFNTIRWALQFTGKAFAMSPFTGDEIIQFSSEQTDYTSVTGLKDTFHTIYRHIIMDNKPNFETWLKQISAYDVECLFFAIYISCYKDNNFLSYECPNKSCGKMFIEKRDIEDMIVYPNEEEKARFHNIIKTGSAPTKLFRTKPIPISKNYAISFITQSIWSSLFEPAALTDDFVTKHTAVINILSNIDRMYRIDKINKKYIPVEIGVIKNDIGKSVIRKVQAFSDMFKTLSMDERTRLFVKANKIINIKTEDVIQYQRPATKCPKCGTEIPAFNAAPLDLLFTRAQLPIAEASIQD